MFYSWNKQEQTFCESTQVFPMNRSSTYEELKDAIAAAYQRLSPQQQQIAQFALERPRRLALGTVATVAEAAAVQPSALIRFANALEFGGFTEMQQVFRRGCSNARAATATASPHSHAVAARPPAPDTGVLHQFVAQR